MDLTSQRKARTTKDSSENFLINSIKKLELIESDRGKEFCNNIFQNFLKNNNIKHYSRNTFPGVVFAERFNCTFRDLPKRPVFERRYASWFVVLPIITKQYNNRVHTSTQLTQIQDSLKKMKSLFTETF